MFKIKFNTYSPCLDKWFINETTAKDMASFRLYALSLWSGNWSIISVTEIAA